MAVPEPKTNGKPDRTKRDKLLEPITKEFPNYEVIFCDAENDPTFKAGKTGPTISDGRSSAK